ncbi:queuosine salvage protein [Myiozetetes cayanensis]|uniref:queuosine salvage protein n=1 Tax=Myiozetetes cayanensis TaxID=478635 RepID=UPI00215EE6F9|nr:queuosine salvage protein [Myiozetetes cayanensis]
MEGFPSPLESAKFIADHSKDVFVDEEGVRRVAESLFDKASATEFGLAGWKSLHELNPRAADKEAVDWVFLVDTLNFSFWSEQEDQKYLVKYKDKTYSGYWSLCAAVNRALDEGIPITSASYFATMTLEQVRHVFRSDTEVPIPLIEERHRVLNESGIVLLEKFGGSFLTCVKMSEKSAQKLLHLILENFPSYRDVAVFEKKKVSFYKRAQILVADTWSVLEGKGDGSFDDISSLTIFADYRIPQVLVHLKAMKYSEELMKKLREGTLFQSGDKEEVEIRGCSIWCCALICKHLQELYQKKGQDMREKINAVLLDYYLWDYARDHREDMKDIPFHRVRCIYY